MKTKEQRQIEIKQLLKEKKEEIPLGNNKVPKKANTYKNPKNPHIKAFHLVSDCKYDDQVKNKRLFKDWKKEFKKQAEREKKVLTQQRRKKKKRERRLAQKEKASK